MRQPRGSMWLWGLLFFPGQAAAHGLWGHVHVTGWAVENMPDDELRAFLLEPEVFNALLFGATFTDSGYALNTNESRAYSEHTHWEPFIEDFVEWIRVNDPPPWDSLESRKRVAFLMGCASHGLQDSIFDSLFLYQIEERDGAGQEEADPGTDGFLVMDDHVRFVPEQDLPMETLLELYAGLNEEITESVILQSLALVTTIYINDGGGQAIAETLGESYAEELAWTRTHYLDPEVPGSLRAEIYPTLRYQQAIWARLHGTWDANQAPIYAFPEAPRRLRSHRADTVDAWVSFIFGIGVQYEEGLVELVDQEGQAVPFTQGNTRWGASYTRLIRLMPAADLQPGGWYTARLRAGIQTIDGQTSTQPWELTFQVECDEATAADCDDLGEIDVASIDGFPESTDTGDTASPTPPPGQSDGCGCTNARAHPRGLAWATLPLLLSLLSWRGRRGAHLDGERHRT